MVQFFIHRPVFATVCALLIILAGVVSIPSLPVAQFPQLAPPQVSVQSVYIGASAQVGQDLICRPLSLARRRMQLGWREPGGQRGNAWRCFCQQGQNLLDAEGTSSHAAPPFARNWGCFDRLLHGCPAGLCPQPDR